MKILFILDEFLPENSGGAAIVAFNLAKGLRVLNHEILVLTATYDKNPIGNVEIQGIKIRKIHTYPFGKLRNFKNLKNRNILKRAQIILAEYKPDVVHIHTLHNRFSYGIIKLAKKYSQAVFVTLHDAQTIFNGKLFPKEKTCGLGSENYKKSWLDCLKKDNIAHNPFQRFLIKRALKKVDKIFTVSNALKNAVEANGISNVGVMYNGIDAKEWTSEETYDKNILFAGRIDEAKGVKVLINAFNSVNLEIPDAKLIIVGDSDFSLFRRFPVGRRAEENKNISILPWQSREEMKRTFSQAAVVVVPSLYLDPFPTVNLEAMASAKPVIGTCFGGTPEIVVDNETGYIINPYNEKKLADKIIDLLKNPEKAARFGSNGYERIKKFFSLGKQVRETFSWYQKFL